jgi:hypothetical protein
LASYLLGFLALAIIAISVLFYTFGMKLRGILMYNPGKGKSEKTRIRRANTIPNLVETIQ